MKGGHTSFVGDQWAEGRLLMAVKCFTPGSSLYRFASVGCMNTAVDFIVFTLLKAVFNIDYLWCQVVAYSAGILNSFIMNKAWTFESKTSKLHTSMQFIKFIFVNLVSLSLSLVGLKLLSGNWDLNVYIAKVMVTIAAQVVNYLGYRFWVFQP